MKQGEYLEFLAGIENKLTTKKNPSRKKMTIKILSCNSDLTYGSLFFDSLISFSLIP